MSTPEEQFLQRLRATFKVEAAEHLQAIASGLLALEKAPSGDAQRPLIEAVFRAAHSLKGAARAVNISEVEAICQSLEETFSAWKKGKSAPLPPALDAAHRTLDAVSAAIAAPPPDQAAGAAGGATHTPQPAASPPDKASEKVTGPADKTADTVRIAISKLDTRLLEAEELLIAKAAARQRVSELSELAERFQLWRDQWARAQPGVRELRHLHEHAPVTEFVEWNTEYVRSLESQIATLRRSAERDRESVGRLVDELLEDSKRLLMLPLSTLSGLLTKIVRDLCRDQAKQAELIVSGEDVEIDRRILEEMKDPLIHLLRNCVDHGIEVPEVRRRLGKPARATIALQVSTTNGNHVDMLVRDDGAGIDVQALKASAAERGLLAREAVEQLDESRVLDLAFEPDVSTSPVVTEISGRGLGLAIVREKTERLGGRVSVESRRHAGTAIRIRLPLTLVTFRGIQVAVGGRLFVVPSAEVVRVARFRPEDVRTVEGRETLALNGRTVALVGLADVLGLPANSAAEPAAMPGATPIVILGAGGLRTAFAVDDVVDEQEVLVKPLNKPLVRVRHIAGATVLGTGQVVPILRVADLLRSAKRIGAARPPIIARPAAPRARSILVVEDSITSRLLLKGILESAGHQVRTANDGLEALAALRAERFDLVVSDVEMPRLNGFDLTAGIRADTKLAQLPVILVTALETREDRERGMHVGANAYLVKSSFDQGDLLEAVRRLA